MKISVTHPCNTPIVLDTLVSETYINPLKCSGIRWLHL